MVLAVTSPLPHVATIANTDTRGWWVATARGLLWTRFIRHNSRQEVRGWWLMDTDGEDSHYPAHLSQSVIRDSTVSALSAVSVATVEVSHFSVLRLPGQQPVAATGNGSLSRYSRGGDCALYRLHYCSVDTSCI